MSQNAQAMADEINKKAKGLKTDTIETWGYQPVRSGDWVYVVLSAKAEGDRLDLIIDDSSQGMGPTGDTRLTISFTKPSGLQASRKSILIADAAEIAWGKDFKGVREGEKPTMVASKRPKDRENASAFYAKSI